LRFKNNIILTNCEIKNIIDRNRRIKSLCDEIVTAKSVVSCAICISSSTGSVSYHRHDCAYDFATRSLCFITNRRAKSSYLLRFYSSDQSNRSQYSRQ